MTSSPLLHLHLRGTEDKNLDWIRSSRDDCDFITCWDNETFAQELILASGVEQARVYHKVSSNRDQSTLIESISNDLIDMCLPVLLEGGLGIRPGSPIFNLETLPRPDYDCVWLLIDQDQNLLGVLAYSLDLQELQSVIAGEELGSDRPVYFHICS